jgi:hypothetical protein
LIVGCRCHKWQVFPNILKNPALEAVFGLRYAGNVIFAGGSEPSDSLVQSLVKFEDDDA